MSSRSKVLIGVLVVLVLGSATVITLLQNRDRGVEVRMEAVEERDLISTVTASGNIRARLAVDISADVMGRVIELNVEEGDNVTQGEILLRIDPSQLEAAVSRAQATLSQAQAQVAQQRASMYAPSVNTAVALFAQRLKSVADYLSAGVLLHAITAVELILLLSTPVVAPHPLKGPALAMLGVTVEPDAEMAPRMRMTSVPWAFRAAVADTVAPFRLNEHNRQKIVTVSTTKMVADAITKIHSGTGSISQLLEFDDECDED